MRFLALTVLLLLSGAASAQVNVCSMGKECTVNNLTTTGRPRKANSSVGAGSQVTIGSLSSSSGAIWMGANIAITSSSYALASTAGVTVVNGIGTVQININDAVTPQNWTSTKSTLAAATYLRWTGVATGSLPTCDASAAGSIQYDTTTTTMKWCNASAWQTIGTGALSTPVSLANGGTAKALAAVNGAVVWTDADSMEVSAAGTSGQVLQSNGAAAPTWVSGPPGVWGGLCLTGTGTGGCESDAANTTPFLGGYKAPRNATSTTVTCSWAQAGTGGTEGVVVHLVKLSDASEVCNCTIAACTVAANTPSACTCSGALSADTLYGIALKGTSGTDCASNPDDIFCNVAFVETP